MFNGVLMKYKTIDFKLDLNLSNVLNCNHCESYILALFYPLVEATGPRNPIIEIQRSIVVVY